MTKFTDLTKGELITRIIEQYDPEIGSDVETIITCNLEKPDDHPLEKTALKIRGEKYYTAPMDWNYYDTGTGDLEWEEITRKTFKDILQESCEADDINTLRSNYHNNKLLKSKMNTIIQLRIKSDYHRARNEANRARIRQLEEELQALRKLKKKLKKLTKK